MTTSILSHSLKVYKKISTLNNDVRFNIIKRRELILYKTSTINDNVNLAYVINDKITSSSNLKLADRSNALAENHFLEDVGHTVFTAKSTTFNTDFFVLTDVFVELPLGLTKDIPLFYKHKCKEFNADNVNHVLVEVVLLNDELDLITDKESKVDYDTGYIFNNLTNVYQIDTNRLEVYYIRYAVRDTSTGLTTSYTEILDNENAYQLASFEDIDSFGALDVTKKVYTVENLASNKFEIILPSVKKYAIKAENSIRLEMLLPPDTDGTNPWFVSIRNSQFFATIQTSLTSTNIAKYNVPEFILQSFNPEYPYKLRTAETAIFINKKLAKVQKAPIAYKPDVNLHLYVTIRNSSGTLRKAFSTDPTLVGTTVENNIIVTNGIRSVDTRTGLIDFREEIKLEDIIQVDYYFIETSYEYLDIDFNPISNPEILKQRIIFYAVPNTSDSRPRTVYHLVVDRQGKILSTSQTDNIELTNDIATNNFFYDKDPDGAPTLNFLDAYTVQASIDNKFANVNNPFYLVLAEALTRENSHPNQAVIIDIRKLGGGIKEANIEALIETFPEVLWTTSAAHWNGQQYPGTASFLVEIPNRLQYIGDGHFNDIALRKIIEKHSALGSYPIVRGYHHGQPDFTLEAFETSVKVSWRSLGAEYKYNVYYSLNEDYNFELANDSPITNNASGNSFTITGLLSGVIYNIYVVAYDESLDIDLPPTVLINNPTQNYPRPIKKAIKTVLESTEHETSLGHTLYYYWNSEPPGDPLLWFDASDVDGEHNFTVNNNDVVGTWTNKGSLGTAVNAIQNTEVSKPTVQFDTISGKPIVRFDVSNDFLTTPAFAAITQPFLICQIIKLTEDSGSTFLWQDTAGDSARSLVYKFNDKWSQFSGSDRISTTNVEHTQFHLVISEHNSSSGYMRLDKISLSMSGDAGSNGLGRFHIGGAGASGGQGYDVAEYLVYADGTSFADIEAYFDNKYGSTWPKT